MTSSGLITRARILRYRRPDAVRTRRGRRPLLELMEDRTLLSSGQLDPSFGYQGIVPQTFVASDVISYPDGRILAAGEDQYNESFVERFTADGQLDPTFGTLGKTVDPGGVAVNYGAEHLALQPDGKIVETSDTVIGIKLIRYNPDGSIDSSFATAGETDPLRIADSGVMDATNGGIPVVLPDGRILVAASDFSKNAVALAMFRPDGTLDPSFNGTGTLLATGPGAELSGVAIEDNRILVLTNDTYLERFNLDGSVDTSFGTAGAIDPVGATLRNTVGLYGQSMIVQPDGRVVVADYVGSSESLTRYDADGSPDPTFGSGGTVTLDPSSFEGGADVGFANILLQPNGKILLPVFVSQYSNNAPFYPQIERFNPDGTIDTGFGQDGLATVVIPPAGQYIFRDVAMQSSGRIIGVAETASGSSVALVGVAGDPVVTFDGATSVSTISGSPTAEYDVSETGSTATITLRRSGDLSQSLTVPFSTNNSGGLAGVNYTSVHTTATFAAGSETTTVAIPILDDPNASAAVDVPLVLGTPSGGAILGDVAAGDLHIIPVEGIAISPTQVSSVMQGGAGSSFTIALKSVPTGNVTVPLSISTTNPGATLSTSTLTFTPANALTPQTVAVTAAGGSGTAPATATISVGPATSTDPKYNGLTGGSATVGVYGSIASSPGWIEFAAANFTVDENAGTAQITLVRLGGSSGSVSVHFATSDGTYAAAGKYTPLSGSISFGAGATSKMVTINLIDPGHNLQGDQTVDLTLSNPTGGAQLGVFPTATLTLHDTSRPVAGDLDSSFGSDGKSILPDDLATASAIAPQSDGKLVIAGTGGTAADGSPLVRVWRTDAYGQPDPGFGLQGVALVPFPNFVQVKGVAVGPDGKIVVVGNATKPAGGNEFALLRLNADGRLDTGFGTNGLVTTSFSAGDDMPGAVFVESDGSIYVAGTVDTASNAATPFAFAHYGPDGSVDVGFGNGGAQIIPAVGGPAGAVLQQPNGQWLVIAGGGYDANSDSDRPGYAVRLNSDFTPDSTFGTAGVATLTWSEFYDSVALQPDGKILIGGGEAQSGLATLGRLNTDGSLDTTFGSGGSASTVFNVTSGGDFGITSAFSFLLVQPDGEIVAIGEADDVGVAGHYFTAEARYLNNGSPDTTFADGGSRWFTLGDGNDSVAGAVALSNGDIAFAATTANLPVVASILTAGSQKPPTITWPNPASIVYGTSLGGTQLDAAANVPGNFTYSPAAGTVLQAGSNQTLSATFSPTNTTDYTTAAATATISVTKATPTITWANPPSLVYGTALSATQLDATASWVVGGQTVSVPGTFAYTPAAGTVLHAGNDQTLSVTFTPTDTTDYATAIVTKTLNVSQATPTITWANPADITPGTPLGAAQLDATASVPGSFTYIPAAGTILSTGDNQALSVTFTPTDTTDYTSATAVVHIDVTNIKRPTIIWADPASIVYGTGLGAVQLDATASVAGTFAYSPPAGTVLGAGSHTLSVTFNPTDSTNYKSVTANTTLVVTPAMPTINWAGPASIIYGTALGAAQLDATSSVPGAFAYSPAAGTILLAGNAQTLSVTFTPSDTTDYTTAIATATINVAQATPTISWAEPGDITAGTPLGGAQLDATASVPGVLTYTPAAGSLVGAGPDQSLTVTFTPTDTTDYTVVRAGTLINVVASPPHIKGIVGVSRTKKGLTAITIGFDEALDSGSVGNPALYNVLGAVKKHRKTVYTKGLGIKGISFDGNTRVTINFAKPYKGAVKLTVAGSILAADGASSDTNYSAVVD